MYNTEENTNKIKKVDRRVVKTKRAICSAFAELMSEKSINDITIKDIADTADINRKTVYNYYSGIHEILDEVENKVVYTYEKLIQDLNFTNGFESIYNLCCSLTTVIKNNMDFYSSLLKINTNSQLITKIVSTLKRRLKQSFLEQKLFDEDKVDTVINYVVPGMLGAYQCWFNSGREQPIEDFSQDLTVIVLSGMKALSNK